MRNSRLAVLAVLALSLTACAGNGSGGSASGSGKVKTQGISDSEIKIVGFGPLTGPASWVGLGNRDGFTLGINEINAAGGVHGRKIKFEFHDDGFEVAKAQQVVRRILQQDKPFLVYAGTGSTTFLSVADTLRQSGLAVYNGFSGSEAARKTPEVPTMFHGEAVSTKWVAPSMVDVVTKQLKAKRIAVISEDGQWGKSLCEDVLARLKSDSSVEVVTQQTYPAAGTDFTGQLVAVRKAEPEVVVNCGLFPAAKILLRQANELGLKALFVGDAGQANPTVWSGNESATNNWLFNWYEPQFMTDTTGPMGEFLTKYKAAYPSAPEGRPNHADTFSYNAAYLLKAALEKAGKDLDRDKFLTAMKETSNVKSTPISPNIDCANERNECFVDLVWMRVQSGKPAPAAKSDWPELASIIAGD